MKVMHLPTFEFIRRFLMHVLPDRFHRIRHYGFLAGAGRKEKVARVRSLLGTAASGEPDQPADDLKEPMALREPCPGCGGTMRIVETFRRGQKPRTRAPPRKQAA